MKRVTDIFLIVLVLSTPAACSERQKTSPEKKKISNIPQKSIPILTSLFKGKNTSGVPPSPGLPSIKLVKKVKTGSLPKGVVVSPDGSNLFVTNFGRVKSWNVFAYSTAPLKRTGMLEFDGNGVEMAITPDGKRLLVSNFRKHSVLEADTETLKILRTYPVGKNPKTIAVASDGKRAYVSNWTSDSITAMDLESGEVLGSVHTGNQPRGIGVSPDGSMVYVSNCKDGTISFVDTASMEVVHTLEIQKNKDPNPRHLVVSPDGSKLYVTAMHLGLLYVIDTKLKKVVGRAETGGGPKTVDLTPDGRYAFTADFSNESITAVNLATLESAKFSQTEIRRPCGLAVSPDGKKLYVTGWNSRWLGQYDIILPENKE